MKLKPFFILLIFAGFGAAPAKAQVQDRLLPHFGFMWEFVQQISNQGTVGESRELFANYYNFAIGTYYVIGHRNDVMSYGVDGTAQFGFNFVGGQFNYVAQIPVYLMGRIGANSTPYNMQKFGLSAGFGFHYTYFTQVTGSNIRQKAHIFNPSIVFEATLNSSGNPLTGRVHFTPFFSDTKVTQETPVTTLERQVPMGGFGLGLIYGF
ncbi:hypothetical protein [Pontibacter sp. G13]|uniref:hypothetical protein n=1 Tax=Pontibacter sp. G13 TaxID=3074898 RepID=UPI00288A33EF|nr:hypothetical protein [Pontibacter sp. G13]WNJ20931.1 hypothetical protein RJD25_10675 [Pontibacter sp. G13]